MGDTVVITRKLANVTGPGDKQFPGAFYQAGEFGRVQGFDTEEMRASGLDQVDELTISFISRYFPEGTKFEIQPQD